VETYAFTPDGKTLVTASSDDGAVRLWDTTTGQQRARLSLPPETKLVQQMTFSPDGKVLAITGLDQVIRLWDAGTGKPRHVLRWPAEQGVSPVIAFGPDSKKLASWTNDFTVRLWDVGTGREVGSFVPSSDKAVRQLVFGPDDTTLVMVFDDGKAQLWDPAAGKKRRQFRAPGQSHWCHAAAISPDGKMVATGGLNDVCLWETATGQLRQRLTGYKRPILALAFSPDGLSLSTASDGGECRVWRVADGQELHGFQLPVQAVEDNPVRKLVFSRDGATLAWNHWRQHEWVRLTDVKTGKQVETLGQPAAALAAFAPDGKTVATPTEDGRLRLWETATGKEVCTFAGAPGKVEWLGFTADGKTLISVGKEVIFWDAGTGKEIRRRAAPQVTFDRRACALLPGGKILAVGEADYSRFPQRGCRVFLWDLEAARELRRFGGAGEGLNRFDTAHGMSVTSLAVSLDGKLLASAGRDDTVRLWDVGTGKELRRWGVEGQSNVVAFADGGKNLVAASAYFKAGSDAFRLVRWELVGGKERERWEGFSPGVVNIPALFSPDGRTLACAHQVDGLDLFQAHHGKVSLRLRTTQQELAMPIAFSPDGRLLASWHGNATVLIWDVSQR
jgi:WD40 repeat protein